MGIKVNITNVDKEARTVSFNHDGQDKVLEIVGPAKIDYAKVGLSEIGFDTNGKVNFVKSLAKPSNQESDQKPKYKALNEVEISEGVTLQEFKEIYNRMNAGHMKINATNIINNRLVEGKHLVDVVYFTTRFEKLNPSDNTI